jgi:hypothetical protein
VREEDALASSGKRNRADDDRRAQAAGVQTDEALERLRLLERTVGADAPAFFEVGQALIQINEERLYRLLRYATFAEYIDRRVAASRGYAYRMMSAARIVGILRGAGVERLPSNEAQARELAPLIADPFALCRVWLGVVMEGAPGEVTAAKIRSAVARIARPQ